MVRDCRFGRSYAQTYVRLKKASSARRRATSALPLVAFLLAALVLAAGLAGACGSSAPDVPPARILLIGNSFTYINGGIDQELAEMAPSATVKAVTAGGFRLQNHWDEGRALAEIRSGHYDFVVLQEQSQTPVIGFAGFADYARRFDREVRAAGGTTVLLMTWERPDSVQYGVTTANLAAAYQSVGTSLAAKVAPAGLAFAEAQRERPGLTLTVPDGHPTVAGTYLATCVLYGTIYGRSPVGVPYAPLSDEDRDFLQGVAAKTLGL
jgi:hypothetical protein